jgi:hypothetical protein
LNTESLPRQDSFSEITIFFSGLKEGEGFCRTFKKEYGRKSALTDSAIAT